MKKFSRKEENLNKHFPEGFFIFKAGILNKPGTKFIPNEYINEIIKLIIESLIRWTCELTYIPQKHVI